MPEATADAMAAPVPDDGRPAVDVATLLEGEPRRSEESEALHRLLVDTRRKFDDLDALKGALDEMVLPFRGAMRALDQERALSADLSRQLGERGAAYDELRDELQHAESRAQLLSMEAESLRDALHRERESGRATENARILLGEEIKRRDAAIAALEHRLNQEALQREGLGESFRILQAQTRQAEERAAELQDALAQAEQRRDDLQQDKRTLWQAAEQAREDAERLNRRLAEGEGALGTVRAELDKAVARHAEVCADRDRLADAVDELNAQREAERQGFSRRVDAVEARAAAAERQVAEMRQRLIERTEEARAFICKAAEAAMARAAAERRLATLEVARGIRGRADDDPTETRTALSEYLRALNLKSREMALANGAEKMALLSERHAQATQGRTVRADADKQVENLVAAFEDEHPRRSDIEKTLDAARQANARLTREMADLSAELSDAAGEAEPVNTGAPARPNEPSGTARAGGLRQEAGFVAQLRRPAEEDDSGRSVA